MDPSLPRRRRRSDVLETKCPSFERKRVVGEAFKAIVRPKIFIASKVGESFGTTFPLLSLDATIIGSLLEVEKLLNYKLEVEEGKHFMLHAAIYEGKCYRSLLILCHGIKDHGVATLE